MAYRQLFAVTFTMLAVVSVGCGGESTSAGGSSSATEQQPPSNADQPPNNSADQAPKSADDPPPGNGTDAPPANVDAPAGSGGSGRLVDLCQKFCDGFQKVVDSCSMGDSMADIGSLCPKQQACQVPANYPCVDQAADLFDCALTALGQICSAGSDVKPDSPLSVCEDEVKATNDCVKANGGSGTSGGGGSGGGPSGAGGGNGNGADCMIGSSCACPGQSACAACRCKAGTDVNKILACGSCT